MKKLGAYLLYGGALLFAALIIYASVDMGKGNGQNAPSEHESDTRKVAAQNTKPADKIQVFLFHNTERCYSCITIGKFAKKTVEKNFPNELKSGKIEFKEVNIDLPENEELATKFRAAGSSLFINPIIDGKDNIKEDTQVWRLVSDEQAFVDYLSEKISKLL